MSPAPMPSIFRIVSVALTLLLSMALGAAPAAARDMRITTSITPSYYSGTYGTNFRTDIFYLPLGITAKTGDLTLKATIPYIRVTGPGVIVAGGVVVGTTGGQRTTRSGLGDIWLEARYRLHLNDAGSSISPYVKLKLGTASRSKGLGTGANDVEFGGILRTRLATRFYPFAQLGYRIYGQVAGIVLNDVLTYKAGVSYVVNATNIATVLYAGHESSHPGIAAASELVGAWNYRVRRDTDLQLYGLLGLSNGSPDYGLGLSYMYHF